MWWPVGGLPPPGTGLVVAFLRALLSLFAVFWLHFPTVSLVSLLNMELARFSSFFPPGKLAALSLPPCPLCSCGGAAKL